MIKAVVENDTKINFPPNWCLKKSWSNSKLNVIINGIKAALNVILLKNSPCINELKALCMPHPGQSIKKCFLK